MIKVVFSDFHEIRTGSPFQSCNVRLEGSWVPELGARSWQPLSAYSSDQNCLALAVWEFGDSRPGFRVIVIDENNHSVRESGRIPGCCTSLLFFDRLVYWKAFTGCEDPEMGTAEFP